MTTKQLFVGFITAPIKGLAFAIFLPAVGFYVLAEALFRLAFTIEGHKTHAAVLAPSASSTLQIADLHPLR